MAESKKTYRSVLIWLPNSGAIGRKGVLYSFLVFDNDEFFKKKESIKEALFASNILPTKEVGNINNQVTSDPSPKNKPKNIDGGQIIEESDENRPPEDIDASNKDNISKINSPDKSNSITATSCSGQVKGKSIESHPPEAIDTSNEDNRSKFIPFDVRNSMPEASRSGSNIGSASDYLGDIISLDHDAYSLTDRGKQCCIYSIHI